MTHRFQRSSYPYIFPVTALLCVLLVAVALAVDGPARVWEGLQAICLTQDILITDYTALAGVGAALTNSALVTLAAVAVLRLTHAPVGGGTCAVLGLMAGFALFGKDIFNIWPIVFGSLLCAQLRHEPLGKYAGVGLMSTCLAPIVSFLWFTLPSWQGVVMGTAVGVCIGLLLPLLSAHTALLLKGMNLYNVGFACGVTALIVVPVLVSAGLSPTTVLIWGTGYNALFSALLFPLFALAILAGVLLSGGLRPAWEGLFKLLKAPGVPSDFLAQFGPGPCLINMGLCGALYTGYILLIGGELNGTTVGGILTVAGFAFNGKHLRSAVSLLAGVVLAGVLLPGFSLTDPAIQFSALFCTTLAPLAGTFGFSAGALAGFIHICLVQRTGVPVCGLNLYNNGFTGGVVSIALYPVLCALLPHRVKAER